LNLQVSAGVFSLLKESCVVDSPPDYVSAGNTFAVKVFSNGDGLLKEFGIRDPGIVQAEDPGVAGPTWRENTNFQLVVPYFVASGRVDLIEAASGNLVLSTNISQYATVLAPKIDQQKGKAGNGLAFLHMSSSSRAGCVLQLPPAKPLSHCRSTLEPHGS
jgi:hypothetical protein